MMALPPVQKLRAALSWVARRRSRHTAVFVWEQSDVPTSIQRRRCR